MLSAPGGAGAEAVTEDVLVTIAILRQYEEMDGENHQFPFLFISTFQSWNLVGIDEGIPACDKRCHLLGTTRILNSVSHFGSSGGLGEAAAWLCLRQDIYVSLVSRQPLRTHLEHYLNSRTFRRNDDVCLANRMVFLLAKVLSCAFHAESVDMETGGMMSRSCSSRSGGGGDWKQMNEEVEDWRQKLPSSFEPILFRPPCREQGRGLPEVWMLAPFHGEYIILFEAVGQIIAKVQEQRSEYSTTTSRRLS